MIYTKEDIYDGMKFINENGKGTVFIISEIGETYCTLSADSPRYPNYKSTYYFVVDLLLNLSNRLFVKYTSNLYEIY